jgi:hypothetical protein
MFGVSGAPRKWVNNLINAIKGDGWTNETIKGNATSIASLTQYQPIAAVTDIFTFDLQNSPYKNLASTTADATAKTVAVANVPTGRCEFVWELTYTNAAAITWFAGITWQGGSAPALTAGKTYAFLFQTSDGGTTWRGTCVEW